MKDRCNACDVGRRIYEARKSLGYTLEDVGKLLGTTKATISRYETGVINDISIDIVPKLCQFLGITPNELFGWGNTNSIIEKDKIIRAKRTVIETPSLTTYGRNEWCKFSKRRSASTLSGYIYLAQIGDLVKIGKTIFPYGRIIGLKVMFENYGDKEVGLCAISEEHRNYIANEKILHKYFEKDRIPKTELFRVDFDRAISEIRNGWTGITVS